MNRNVESHFAENPVSLDISRSQFDRSCSVKFSANVGQVIPFFVDEVLPGDTFKISTSKVVRLQTMLKPIMDNMYLDTYYFYVRNILLWKHWTNFMGESERAWVPAVTYTVPKLVTPANGFPVGSLADYMGIPPSVKNYKINALPFRAYAKVMDDWFRDTSLLDPCVISDGDSDTAGGNITDDPMYCANGGPVFVAAKYHDYFTSCLPAPQSGPSVLLPLGNLAPVYATTDKHFTAGATKPSNIDGLRIIGAAGSTFNALTGEHAIVSNGDELAVAASSTSQIAAYPTPNNLWADLSTATAATINDLRTAFQVQKFYEKCARGGRRYVEQLKVQFGVTSEDGRLLRSEYLGGNRIPIMVHEVTNNSEGASTALGNLGAMSRTVDTNDDFVKSFTEHGYVIGVCVVRYDHTYGQGLDPMYLRDTIFDHYFPVFANIGEKAVTKKELWYDNVNTSKNDEVFGYQEAWAEYRYKPNRVCGEMRPEASNTLASWHLADDYNSMPALSKAWIGEDPANVDRTLAVTSANSNQYFADIFVKNICTRAMPLYSIPGLIDHH